MSKQRLTITLSNSTINKLDQLIDKKMVRSRSHAIETILQKELKPSVNTAVILAGGDNTSKLKPLINYQDRPLIFHLIDHLKQYQISNIIILTHNKAQILKTEILKQFPDTHITYIFEPKPLGTAGALKNISHLLTQPFYCLHADVFTNINLQELAVFHEQHQGIATISAKPRMPHFSFDNISVQGSQVIAFQPKSKDPNPSLVNSGVYLFEPEILNFITNKVPAMLEKDVFPKLVKLNKLFAFSFDGVWLDVTTEKKYQEDLFLHKTSNQK